MYRTIEAYLEEWKAQEGRLPIILRGARQVGKSFTVEKFGKTHFSSTVTANFEFKPELAACFETYDPLEICAKLEVALKTRIVPKQNLLFLDEIQNCPRAITSLRYFKEKMPDLHVIAAGSLLEFALHEEQFSFPVGRVEFLYLKPLSFYEYLINQEHTRLVEQLDQITLSKPFDGLIHDLLLKALREYFLIGGMPLVVETFLKTHSFLECQTRLFAILETYRADFPKYATKSQYKYLQTCFEKIPQLLSQHLKYTLISSESRSDVLKIALQQLGWAGVIHRVIATSASGLPLSIHSKESQSKLLFLDIGLANCANKLELDTTWEHGLLQINAGALAEQFVGQELLAYANPHLREQLYFWKREKMGSMAEVDYVVQIGSHIVPIEVKAGKTGSLKSLTQFLEEKKVRYGVRISQHPLSLHDRILSVPLYLIKQLPRLLHELYAQ
jgi:predicted AAA+ superfamily ATPase